jgi:23S rRNA pseudouridine2457 synthase
MLLLFNKPFDVLCQFTAQSDRPTLKNFIKYKGLYPCGRLDRDSEGLLLLTDEGRLQHLISHPKHKLQKRYWVQVESAPSGDALSQLRQGVELKDGMSAPAQVRIIDPPDVWPRTPPIRFRANIPTTWLELTLREGRNRQVRRMTAAVGHPTLRLIRIAIGPWKLDDIQPGHCKQLDVDLDILPNYWRKILNQPNNKKALKKQPARPEKKRKPSR